MSQTIQVLQRSLQIALVRGQLQRNQGGIKPLPLHLRKLRLCQLDYGLLLSGCGWCVSSRHQVVLTRQPAVQALSKFVGGA